MLGSLDLTTERLDLGCSGDARDKLLQVALEIIFVVDDKEEEILEALGYAETCGWCEYQPAASIDI